MNVKWGRKEEEWRRGHMLTFHARHSCTYSMSLCFSDISSDERLACLLHTTFMHTQILYTHTSTHDSSPEYPPTRTHKAICHAPTSSAQPISCQSHSAIWLVTSGQSPDKGSSCTTVIYASRGLLEGLLHYCLQPWKILILKRFGGRLSLTLVRWWPKICILVIIMETCI